MATAAQTDANRRNAQRSTGPRTQQGKLIASRNATTHGIFCQHLLLPGEDPNELGQFRFGIYQRLAPADALERLYVERIVACAWRMQRALANESQLMHRYYCSLARTDERLGSDTEVEFPEERLGPLQKHIASLERGMDKALAELSKLQKARREAGEEERGEWGVTECGVKPSPSKCENEANPSARQDETAPSPIRENEANPIESTRQNERSASATVEIVRTNPILALEAEKEGANQCATEDTEDTENAERIR